MNGKILVEESLHYTSYKDCIRIPFLFQGQYLDSETGLAYNRFRYYSPELGQYISQDPIGFAGGTLALFSYVEDTNAWVDVLGLSPYIFSEELAKIAREAHNVLIDPKYPQAFNNRTVAVARVEVNGGSQLYASGNAAELTVKQKEKLVALGVPKENIFSGAKFKADIDGKKGELTKLANHAERVIERNIPVGSVIKEWGISWASKQKNEMCSNCKTHFKCGN
jgi:RHS repeat-associated protein